MTRLLRNALLLLVLIAALLYALLHSVSWQPEPREKPPVICNAQAPTLVRA